MLRDRGNEREEPEVTREVIFSWCRRDIECDLEREMRVGPLLYHALYEQQ